MFQTPQPVSSWFSLSLSLARARTLSLSLLLPPPPSLSPSLSPDDVAVPLIPSSLEAVPILSIFKA